MNNYLCYDENDDIETMKIIHVKEVISLTRMNVDKFLIFPFYYHVSDAWCEFHGGYAYQ